jgi:hypothetical protein
MKTFDEPILVAAPGSKLLAIRFQPEQQNQNLPGPESNPHARIAYAARSEKELNFG